MNISFLPRAETLSVSAIAALTGAEVRSERWRERAISGTASLDLASPGDLTLLDHERDAHLLALTRAGACLVMERLASAVPAGTAALVTDEPYRAFVTAARRLFAESLRPSSLFGADGVSTGAVVHPTARLESGVRVDPGAVIGPQVEIGAETLIGPGTALGRGVRLGRHCRIGAGATLTRALIGDGVIVHPGTRIGQDGVCAGAKLPPSGRVIIQDGVEIGANCTIDNGAIRDTVIGEGTRIDSLVHIADNVRVGRHCIIAAQASLDSHAIVGDFVALGVGIRIGDRMILEEGATIPVGSAVDERMPVRT